MMTLFVHVDSIILNWLNSESLFCMILMPQSLAFNVGQSLVCFVDG